MSDGRLCAGVFTEETRPGPSQGSTRYRAGRADGVELVGLAAGRTRCGVVGALDPADARRPTGLGRSAQRCRARSSGGRREAAAAAGDTSSRDAALADLDPPPDRRGGGRRYRADHPCPADTPAHRRDDCTRWAGAKWGGDQYMPEGRPGRSPDYGASGLAGDAVPWPPGASTPVRRSRTPSASATRASRSSPARA